MNACVPGAWRPKDWKVICKWVCSVLFLRRVGWSSHHVGGPALDLAAADSTPTHGKCGSRRSSHRRISSTNKIIARLPLSMVCCLMRSTPNHFVRHRHSFEAGIPACIQAIFLRKDMPDSGCPKAEGLCDWRFRIRRNGTVRFRRCRWVSSSSLLCRQDLIWKVAR
jgi:hypothetical protein